MPMQPVSAILEPGLDSLQRLHSDLFATAEHSQYAHPCDRVHVALTMPLCCIRTSPQQGPM